VPGDFTTEIGKIDYSQPKLGFEGLPELERFDECLNLILCTLITFVICW